MSRKKRVATLKDPTFEAIAEGLFRLQTEMQAVSLLDRLGKQHIISKDQDKIEAGKPPTLTLWIRGYAVTKEEEKKGYKGHFAKLSVKQLSKHRYTIIAEKQDVPLESHPQKIRKKSRHPNWGHPILRTVEKEKPYPTADAARADLLRLHEEYPEISIPGRDKLHLMVYSRQKEPPIERITLRLHPLNDGTFLIKWEEQKKKEDAGVTKAQQAVTEEAAGKFTKMVALSRKRKKPTTPKG